MKAYRVLVTGSRDWDDSATVANALSAAQQHLGVMTVVHGACPRGADAIASAWVTSSVGSAVLEEAHPANWTLNGKRAGFIRNQLMVNLGADVCFAFVKNGSRGASHTAALAEQAGIPTRRWTA